jgi:dihydroflavonol-4-reductase
MPLSAALESAMVRVAITGASGLIGGNLALHAADRGWHVRALRRSTSRIGHLPDVGLEWVEAGLDDVLALTAAFRGCDGVFHCAAALDDGSADDRTMYRVNVEGTKNVLEAVRKGGVRRLVFCSTTNTIGIAPKGRVADESTPWNWDMYGLATPYTMSKLEAERLVLAANGPGLEIVVANPSLVLGSYDARPGSGRLLIELIRHPLVCYPPGVKNYVHVRDVGQGLLAAAEQGRAGERYILGGENLPFRDFCGLVARASGNPAPKFGLARPLVHCAGLAGEAWCRVSGRKSRLDLTLARFACLKHPVSSARARRELGYVITPVSQAIRDAIDWFRQAGMLPGASNTRTQIDY